MRLCAALLLIMLVSAAGCGGDSDTSTRESGSASRTAQTTDTLAQLEEEADEATAESAKAQYGYVLAQGRVAAAEFCLAKAGGTQPTDEQRKAKRKFVRNAEYTVEQAPEGLTIPTAEGEITLAAFLYDAASDLRTGGCDPSGAAKLESLADRAP